MVGMLKMELPYGEEAFVTIGKNNYMDSTDIIIHLSNFEEVKEALEESKASNVVQGEVSTLNTEDSLVYNLESNKLVTTVGLKGMVVVNTPDALVVVPKDEVVQIPYR